MTESILKELDVVELHPEEARQIQAGWWQWFVSFVLLQALVNPEAHMDSFMEGFAEGRAATD